MDYSSVDEMWLDAVGELVATEAAPVDSRAGACTEAVAYCGTLIDPDRTFLLNRARSISPQYAAAELLWYLSGSDRMDELAPYAPSYWRYAEGDAAWGAYGRRWVADRSYVAESQEDPTGQLLTIVELLREKQSSRQAVVTAWNAGDLPHALAGDRRDIPCTLSWQFIRREKLDLVVTMRSQDAWMGLPYDVFVNATLQRIVAAVLGVEPGKYHHRVGCLHLYARNRAAAIAALRPAAAADARDRSTQFRHARAAPQASGWLRGYWRCDLSAVVNTCVQMATAARVLREPVERWLPSLVEAAGDSPLRDAVLLCASKWVPVQASSLCSPLMREAYDANR